MGVITDLDEGNISTSIEEISEEEHQDYLVAKEHLKAQFLKGFKKDEKGQVTKVQDFVISSFMLKNKQVEVISDVSTSSSTCLANYHLLWIRKLPICINPVMICLLI